MSHTTKDLAVLELGERIALACGNAPDTTVLPALLAIVRTMARFNPHIRAAAAHLCETTASALREDAATPVDPDADSGSLLH